jgi:hypothetical protein
MRLSWKGCCFRCRPQLVLTTWFRVFPADVSATSCDVRFFFSVSYVVLLPNGRHVVIVSLWRHLSCSPFCHVLFGTICHVLLLSCSLWRQIYHLPELVLVRMYTFFVTMFGDPIQARTGPKNMDTSTSSTVHHHATGGKNCSRAVLPRGSNFRTILTQNTTTHLNCANSRSPWRPPSYHGRHGAPLPALRRQNISQ